MKLRDDIGLIVEGMASLCLPPTDKWVVAYHQVADPLRADRKIPGCSNVLVYGGAGWDGGRSSNTLPDLLGGSMACGASMPCGAGTSYVLSRAPTGLVTGLGSSRVF